MFELGGTTVTLGTLAAALALVAGAVGIAWRRPFVVLVAVGLTGIVHAVARLTDYLDAETVASVRGDGFELAIEAFFAVAGGFDVAFAATGRAVVWALDALDGTEMPGADASVLAFVVALLALVLAGALVSGALVGIGRWSDDSPLGGLLAGLGIVFAALGVLWTWLPVDPADLTALYVLLAVLAIGGGVALGLAATGTGLRPAIPDRSRTGR